MRPAVKSVQLWVERVVIGLSLCPWARPVHQAGGIRYAHTSVVCPSEEDRLFDDVLREIKLLDHPEALVPVGSARPETTILVAPHAFRDDFEEFYRFVQMVEEHLRVERLDEDFQIVAFHPFFRFAGEAPEDPGNYVNRSPHPAIHILRQAAVTAAVESHAHGPDVPQVNQRLLRSLGSESMQGMLRNLRKECMDDDAS